MNIRYFITFSLTKAPRLIEKCKFCACIFPLFLIYKTSLPLLASYDWPKMGFTSSPTIHLPLSLHFTQQSQKGKKDETREPSPGAISQNAPAPEAFASSALEKPHKLQRRAGSLRP